MNKKIAGLAYGAAASAVLQMPNSGNNTMGNKETTAMGNASVTHSVTMSPAQATAFCANGCSPKGLVAHKKINRAKLPNWSQPFFDRTNRIVGGQDIDKSKTQNEL